MTLSSVRAAPEQQKLETFDPQQLIAALADPDWVIRRQAGDRLIRLGPAVRPELVKAARGENAEQRAQATRILRELPWTSDADPPDVRDILQRYGDSNDMARASVIRRLYELRASPTLMRLLREEPSDYLRWLIAWALYEDRETPTLAKLREFQPGDDDAPSLLLAGRVWIELDRPKALTFLRRAIDADSSRPSNDLGLLDFAFDQLITAAMEKHDFEEAAALLRRQVPRDLVPRRAYRRSRRMPSASLPRLVALHEYFGPLRGFGWDCQTWGVNSSDHPRLLDGVTSKLSWLGFSPAMPLGLTEELTMSDRYKAGSFLAVNELTAASDLELDAAAAALDVRGDQRARFMRGLEARDDEGQEMLAELHWRRARAAHEAGDRETADREVKLFADLNPGNADSAIRIINWLKQTKRTEEATTLFNRVYDAGRERIDAVYVKAVAKNDLAWLCARCGERLDEAVKLAQEAVDEMPDVAAFLDTLAEAKYRSGAVDEAIKLETRAMQLSPDSKFMKEQLARFKTGKP
jgi:tetratricopeptide (TPR) repeat protein